jgi:hypothetical protein
MTSPRPTCSLSPSQFAGVERSTRKPGRLVRALATGALLVGLAARAEAQFDNFSWTPTMPAGSFGSVTADQMFIVGPDVPLCSGLTGSFTTSAPYAGTVFVSLAFTDQDKFPCAGLDYPVFILDGVETELLGCFDDSTYAFDVPAGSTFGFGVHSADCFLGAGVASFTQFQFVPTAQSLEIDGGAPSSALGAALARIGDLDGDDLDDLVAGAPGADQAGIDAGQVLLLSSATGATLATWSGAAVGDRFGAAVAGLPDMNGDGVPDVLVGAPGADGPGADAGRAQVRSGADGSVLLTLAGDAAGDHFGAAVAGIADLTGDGIAELLIGAPNGDGPGAVDAGLARLVSGATGATLRNFVGGSAGLLFGTSVADAGDVNADGASDLVVGAPGQFQAPGFARVLSGSTGAVLYQFADATLAKQQGQSVAGAGDVNGDGHADVAIGAPGSGPQSGRMTLYSGATGGELLVVTGKAPNEKLGWAVAGAGDVDGDGSLDIAIGASEISEEVLALGTVHVVSGGNGQLLQRFTGESEDEAFGTSIASLGDLDGDGFGDLAAGAPGADAGGLDTGRMSVLHPKFAIAGAGHALAGTHGKPTLEAKGLLAAHTPLQITLGAALENSSATLVIGSVALLAPFKGGVLVPAPTLLVSGLPTGVEGTLTLAGTWPAGIPSGTALYVQAWIVDAAAVAGASASNALLLLAP